MSSNYIEFNKNIWNQKAAESDRWSTPVTEEEINLARKGEWEVILTPWKPVPREWFGNIAGKKILGLASGGGQQSPVFAAAGANVVSFDLSPGQLKLDKETGDKYGLDITTVEGDMTRTFPFPDESFDIIFNPVSNCFIGDVRHLWRECYRVLKNGGVLLTGFANPVLYLPEESDPDKKIEPVIKNKIPYSDIENLTPAQVEEFRNAGYALEFGHTLEDQVGGQTDAGFHITGFYEDRHGDKDHPLYDIIPVFCATRSLKGL